MKLINLIRIFLTLLVVFQIENVLAEYSCVDCHDEVIGEKTVVHAAAAESCTNCHKKHTGTVPGEDKPDPINPYRLKKQGNALCSTCHEVTEMDHPIASHPTVREADPLYPDKPFGCVSCHNPHASNMPAVFRYNYSSTTVYKDVSCAVCHWDMYGGGRRAPKRPDWKTGE